MKKENITTQILKNEKGLTLVEIIAVIVIIGLIMGVVIPKVFKQGEKAKQELNMVKMRDVASALSLYRLKYNSYPNGIKDLVSPPKKSGIIATKFIEDEQLNDLWGTPFDYQATNNKRSFVLRSFGADGVPGGDGENADLELTP